MKTKALILIFLYAVIFSSAQSNEGKNKGKRKKNDKTEQASIDSAVSYLNDTLRTSLIDSIPSVTFREVDIVSFKTAEEWMMYYKYKSRIQKVLPYVKIARQLYVELQEEKANDNRREYRHYRKDVEKEMRTKFEKELKDLSTGQGEMLFKLINRETGNNAYTIIKDIKGGFYAWMMQIVAKRWDYDLKETYDPQKEKLIELIIKELGPAYNVNEVSANNKF